jgi:hypothetical protein
MQEVLFQELSLSLELGLTLKHRLWSLTSIKES